MASRGVTSVIFVLFKREAALVGGFYRRVDDRKNCGVVRIDSVTVDVRNVTIMCEWKFNQSLSHLETAQLCAFKDICFFKVFDLCRCSQHNGTDFHKPLKMELCLGSSEH